MEHIISPIHAISATAIAANPPGDVKNTSVLEQPIVVFAAVVGGVGVLVGCTDEVTVTRSYPRRVNPALA